MGHVIQIDFDLKQDRKRWRDYIYSRDDTHCADRARWRLLFKDLYGFDNYSYAYLEGDKVRGVVSLYHIPSPFMGNMLVTCPFFGYGGLYADDDRARDALLQRTVAAARELKVDFVELRGRETLPPPFETNTDFLEFDLDLRASPESVWDDRLSSNVRRNIRKSRKNRMVFSISAEYEPCYELLCRTLRAHGTPFHGELFFKLLKKYFEDDVYFSEVRHEGRLVAGGIVIRFRDSIITPYIGSLEKYRNLGSNYSQYWGIIEDSLSRGIGRFEFGRSPAGSTHEKFKQKWGTEKVPVYYNYLVVNPAKKYRSVSRPGRMPLMAAAVWKRLPLSATRLLGPRIFRYIP